MFDRVQQAAAETAELAVPSEEILVVVAASMVCQLASSAVDRVESSPGHLSAEIDCCLLDSRSFAAWERPSLTLVAVAFVGCCSTSMLDAAVSGAEIAVPSTLAACWEAAWVGRKGSCCPSVDSAKM